MNNQLGMPQVAPNVFVKGGRFPSGGETYAAAMNAGMAAFPVPLLDLPLTTSIVPRNSSAVPTFNRASVATFEDWEAKVRTALSGEVRFQGARRVRNLQTLPEAINTWDAIALAVVTPGFIAPDGTPTAFRINGTAGAWGVFQTTFTGPATTKYSCWVKSNTGTNQAFRVRGGALDFIATSNWQRLVFDMANLSASTGFTRDSGNNAADFLVWHPMLEDVTGQSNTNPSEYVSVGALAIPYHGANVDGVKYFDVTNPNIVTGSVVTVSTAAPTAIAGCQYWAEGQRTNLVIQSEDYSTASWVDTILGVGTRVNTASAYRPGGIDCLCTATAAGAGARQVIAGLAGVNHTLSFFVKAGTATTITFFLENGGAAYGLTSSFDLNLSTGVASAVVGNAPVIAAFQGGWRVYQNLGVAAGLLQANLEWRNPNIGTTFTLGMPQLEGGASITFASKYIPTVAAAATRIGDWLNYTSAGSMNATQGTCYAEAQTEWSANEFSTWLVGTDTSGRFLFLSGSGTAPISIASKDAGIGSAAGGGPTAFLNIRRCGSTWSGTVSKSYFEGAAVGTGTNAGSMNAAVNIGIGSQGGSNSNNWSGGIRNVKIWDRALTDTQMQGMVGSI